MHRLSGVLRFVRTAAQQPFHTCNRRIRELRCPEGLTGHCHFVFPASACIKPSIRRQLKQHFPFCAVTAPSRTRHIQTFAAGG